MNNIVEKQFIVLDSLYRLQEVVDNKRPNANYRICEQLDKWINGPKDHVDEISHLLKPYFFTFSKRADNTHINNGFPIINDGFRTNHWVGQQGEDRRLLLDHLIFCLEEDLCLN